MNNLHTTKTPKNSESVLQGLESGGRREKMRAVVSQREDQHAAASSGADRGSSRVVGAEREKGGGVGGKCTFLFLIVSFLCPQDQVSPGPDTDQTRNRGRLLTHTVGSAFFCI